MEDIKNMIPAVDPTALLTEHLRLLNIYYEKSGEWMAEQRQIWLAEMESAVSAANHTIHGSRQALRLIYCTGHQYCMRPIREVVQVDNEGSIRWQRRRR